MINYDKEKLNLDKITSNDLPYLENLLKRKWFAPINNTTDEAEYKFITQICDFRGGDILANYIVFEEDYGNKNIKYKNGIIGISTFIYSHKKEDYTVITKIKNYIKELEEDLDL